MNLFKLLLRQTGLNRATWPSRQSANVQNDVLFTILHACHISSPDHNAH